MTKIRIERQTETIEAEEIIEKEIKPFSKASAHIILPKKFIGQKAFVIIEEATGNFISGFQRGLQRLHQEREKEKHSKSKSKKK